MGLIVCHATASGVSNQKPRRLVPQQDTRHETNVISEYAGETETYRKIQAPQIRPRFRNSPLMRRKPINLPAVLPAVAVVRIRATNIPTTSAAYDAVPT